MATVRRRLRSGHAVWEDRRAIRVPHAPLRGDVQAEVLVMGAGITGALIADALAAAGRDVAIIDRRGIARGSTLVSTALVQYEIDTPLTKLVRKIGRTDAVRAWRRSRLAVEALAMRLSELTVPSVRRRDTLYLAGGVLDGEALRLEHIARRASGLASRFLNRRALLAAFGIRREAALQSFGNLVIDPRQTTLALIRAAAGNGARIFTPVDIVDVYPRKRGVTLTAAGGQTLKCRHLVFATGYELPYGVPRGHHRINSTWAIATVPQRRSRLWPGECTIWEASEPYLYIRTTDDGRVICGGEDEDIANEGERDALLPLKARALSQKLGRLLPKLDTRLAYTWSGTFGETTTGLPIIGQVPDMPHCWIALGYGGNGTTYALIAADVLVGALSGHPDADADLYGFR
jgi:glycine/D-amino acid oxidase-like deaminating enzyme